MLQIMLLKGERMYNTAVKRVLDAVCAFLAGLVLCPFFLLFALLIKIDSKGPVFFKQLRVGRNKVNFTILKFRTMRIDTPKDVPTHMLENSKAYITRMGKFLRRTSLDELPQIFNILSGKMSIIGPRPALWNQDDLVDERDKYKANDVRPGLTGYAQVNGRDELPIPVKAELDGYYVKNLSFMLDVKIFLRTIRNVFIAQGVVEGKEEKSNS